LLDNRFDEGDAVRVLGRVDRFRDRLQLEIRSLEPAEDLDPETLSPSLRRDGDELDGFLEFIAGEISHAGLKDAVRRSAATSHSSIPGCAPPSFPPQPCSMTWAGPSN